MKKGRLIGALASFAVAVLLVYLVLSRAGLNGIKDSLSTMNYWWILAAVIIYTLDQGLEAKRWSYILKDNSLQVGLKDSFFAFNLGNSINIIVPAKLGDVARPYYLKRLKGYSYAKTLPSILMDRFFDVVGVYIVTLLSGVYVITSIAMPKWLSAIMYVGVGVLILAFAAIGILLRHKHKVSQIRNDKIKDFMGAFIEVLEGSISHRRKLLRVVILSALLWTLEGLVSYMVMLSLGVHMNPVNIIFISMIATLTKIIPITPGGIGVFEGAMTVLLVMFGAEAGQAAITSTMNHLIMNLYTLAIGVYVIMSRGISISKIKSEKVD